MSPKSRKLPPGALNFRWGVLGGAWAMFTDDLVSAHTVTKWWEAILYN